MARGDWHIDPGLAAELGGALGWRPDDGAADLAVRLPERVPCGSTAKLAAVAAGQVPPGDDPEALARRILGHLHARAAHPPGGAASPSWSCWVTATVAAALAATADLGPVAVAATRRTDDRAPDADFHAAVVVGEGDGAWLCDPYFGLAVALPDEPGRSESAERGCASGTVRRRPDRGWDLDVRLVTWSAVLSYRLLAPTLDRGDVRSFCAVSVSHTGVPNRPYARLHVEGAAVDVHEDEHGAGIVRHPAPSPPPDDSPAPGDASAPGVVGPVPVLLETTTYPDWVGAADDFAARTGVRII